MGWLAGSFVFIILIFIILLFSQIYFTIDFIINDKEHKLIIAVYLFKIRIIKMVHPSMPKAAKDMLEEYEKEYEMDPSVDKFFQEIREVFQRIKQLHQLGLGVLRRLTFHRLNWSTDVGTGDASSTGVAIGGLWGLKGVLMSYISEHSRLKCQPKTDILPHFQQKLLSTKVDCIVSIRIGQAIYAFIKTIRTLQKS